MRKSGIAVLAALTVLTALPLGAQELERIHPQEEGLSWALHFSRIVAHRGGTHYLYCSNGSDGRR